jgi:exosortase
MPVGREVVGHSDAAIRGTGVAVAFLALLVLYVPTVWSFTGTWNQGIMAHGWLIAGLVVWLIWRQRRDFLLGEGGDPLLLLPLAAISMFWLLATVARIQVFHQLALVLLLAAWGIMVSGRRNLRLVLLLAATFVLAVPIWGALTPVLQRLTTIMSGGMVKLLGIPADIQGDFIRIGVGTFHVADGCAGVGFFVSALAIGALYSHLLIRNWRAQLAVMCVAAGMALFANWFRVGSLIVIGHVTEMQSSLIGSHYGYGWVIFTIGLVPFFLLARQIEKRLDGGTPRTEATEAVDPEQYQRVLKRAAIASVVAAAGPLVYYAFSVLPPASTSGGTALTALAGDAAWTTTADGAHARPFSWQPEYQGATRHETLVFTDGAVHVYADRFVFQRQTQGAKLIGFPNRLAAPDAVLDDRIVGPVDPAGSRWVRQAVVRTPEGAVLTWYWYGVGRAEAVYPAHAKLLEVPAFFTRRRSAEFVALSAPCGPEDCAGAFSALATFTGARVPPPEVTTPD